MEREQQQVPNKREQILALAGWIAFVAQTLATSVQVFLHRRFGERFLGVQAAAVLVVVPVYCLFWEGNDLSGMMIFLGLYLLACLTVRIGIARRRRSGDLEHSFYSGKPDVMRWKLFRRVSEKTAKTIVEPMIVFLCGAALAQFNAPLGCYLMIAAGGLLVSVRLAIGYQRTRVMDMRDAHIDQKNLVERFRQNGW